MTIGERAYKAISDRAAQKGVGIVEYAKSIGISQPNLSHWKNARTEPRAYLLSLMAEAGLDTYWILTGQRVDKVEVVRCGNCKHFRKVGGASGRECAWGNCQKRACVLIYADNFCAYGERRSDNAAD